MNLSDHTTCLLKFAQAVTPNLRMFLLNKPHPRLVDLMKNDFIVKEIITTAQGEMALEEFLKQVQYHRSH